VDAEPVERSAAGAEQRICLPEELRALPPGPGGRRERQLLRLWTLKEAYTKALGQGLRIPARSFGFGLGTDEAFLLDAQVRAPGTGGWSFVTHTVRTGLPAPHLISVAVGQDGDLPPPPTVAPSGRLS
jgi:4'-phosphopantetheinyl transferase